MNNNSLFKTNALADFISEAERIGFCSSPVRENEVEMNQPFKKTHSK